MKFVSILVTAVFALNANATKVVTNAGDPNEPKFKEIALNIQQWIESGNADRIALPPDVPLERYKREMLKVLRNYHIAFDGAKKTCENQADASGENRISCDSAKFNETLERSIDDTYRLIHHEFAGLAGFEVNQNEESDYRISDQISGFLRFEVVKRLPVQAAAPGGSGAMDSNRQSLKTGPDCTPMEKDSIYAIFQRTGAFGPWPSPDILKPCSVVIGDQVAVQEFERLTFLSLLVSDSTNQYCRVISDEAHRYDYANTPTQYEIGDGLTGRYFRITLAGDIQPRTFSPPGCWIGIEKSSFPRTAPIKPAANPNARTCGFTCTFEYDGRKQTANIPGTGPSNSHIFRTDSFDGLSSTQGVEVTNLGCQLIGRRFDTSTNDSPFDQSVDGAFKGNYFPFDSDSGGGFSKSVQRSLNWEMKVRCSPPRF
jgi:hypothetical protein